MNAVLDAIMSRRSVRAYRSDMVPKDVIDQIVQAGTYAASAMGHQSSIIVAVTDRGLRDRLAELNRTVGGWSAPSDPFYGAPVVLVVLAEKDWKNRVYDGSLVMGNLMLAAHALGVGNCWIHRVKEVFDSPEGRDLLKAWGIEGEYEGIGHCVLGYPDGPLPTAAPRKENFVYFAG